MSYLLAPQAVDVQVGLEAVWTLDFTTHAILALDDGDIAYAFTGEDADGQDVPVNFTLTNGAATSGIAISSAGLRFTSCTGNVYLEALISAMDPSLADSDRFVLYLKLDDNPSDAAHQLVWRLGNTGNTYAAEFQRKYSAGKILGYRRRAASVNTDTNTGVIAGPFTCMALEWTRHGVSFWRGTWSNPYPALSSLTRQIDLDFGLAGATAWPWSRATDKLTLRAIGGATPLTATFEKIVLAVQPATPT